ncbi:MAG: class I SAM-dependent methyltransferase [Pseudomonadota bacterium]
MAFSTKIRVGLNKLLGVANLKLDSLTADRREEARLVELSNAGLFDRPVYALLPGMESFDAGPMAEAWNRYGEDLGKLTRPESNDVQFTPDNPYFSTPDMEALYLMIRSLAPRRVVEIGCGHSTRITRQAIIDGGLNTRITAIDPWPRTDIAPFVDDFIQSRVEQLVDYAVFETLEAGDVLFVDSSHEVKLGNDVARIVCDIIPRLKPGVVLHFHDIFLPYEYVEVYSRAYAGWGEQFLLHALLQGKPADLLWPGHYLQRSRPDLVATLPFMARGIAQSFWFRLR